MNLERYEILKRHLPEEAARVIAEAFPAADQLLTRDYLDARLAEFGAELRAEMHRGFADAHGEMHRGFDGINARMLTLMATQWLGVAGIIVAILLQ